MSDKNPDHKRSEESRQNAVEIRYVAIDPAFTDSTEESEIDLLELIKKTWDNRRFIVRGMLFFLILAVIFALSLQNEYQSEAILMPEYASQEQGSGMLSQLGGLSSLLGGGNLQTYAGSSEAIRVNLYPRIATSTPLLADLMYDQVYIPSLDTTATIYDYLAELNQPPFIQKVLNYTIYLPFTALNWVRSAVSVSDADPEALPGLDFSGEMLTLTKEENRMIEDLRSRIEVSLDVDSGLLTSAVWMPDPYVAASVNSRVLNSLKEYIMNYRTEKLVLDLEFLEQRHEEARERFNEAQMNLAVFRDENRNLATQTARTEEERLISEYDLAFNLYSSFAQRLEQHKIKVQEETPLFKELQQVNIPAEKGKPGRFIITLVGIIIGLTVSIGWVLVKKN